MLEELIDWAIDVYENEGTLAPVRDEYMRLFSETVVHISPYRDPVRQYNELIGGAFVAFNPNRLIKVMGLPFCVQYLQYFGPAIKNLKMSFKESSSPNAFVENRRMMTGMFVYCKNLVKIEFDFMPSDVFENFNIFNLPPNESVTTIIIGALTLTHQLFWLAKYFANVTTLVLVEVSFGDSNFRSATFANLRQLTLGIAGRTGGAVSGQILEFLRDNNSLKIVQITAGGRRRLQNRNDQVADAEFMQTFVDMPSLTMLKLQDYVFSFQEAISFLQRCPRLHEFWFAMNYNDSRNPTLRQNLGEEYTLQRIGSTHSYILRRYAFDDPLNTAFDTSLSD